MLQTSKHNAVNLIQIMQTESKVTLLKNIRAQVLIKLLGTFRHDNLNVD